MKVFLYLLTLGGKSEEQSLKMIVDRIKADFDEYILDVQKSNIDLENLAITLYRAASIMAYPNHVIYS